MTVYLPVGSHFDDWNAWKALSPEEKHKRSERNKAAYEARIRLQRAEREAFLVRISERAADPAQRADEVERLFGRLETLRPDEQWIDDWVAWAEEAKLIIEALCGS